MLMLQKSALVLTIIGAINWGLIGLFQFNLIATLFGDGSIITSFIYILYGFCGIINIGILFMDFDYKHHKH